MVAQPNDGAENRTKMVGAAVTPSEKRDIAWLAALKETSVSRLLRSTTVDEAVAEAREKRRQLAA